MARPPSGKPIGTFGKIAIAVGLGAIGYYLLDGHSHTCAACGHRWRHLGAFNFGEVPAHSCDVCGTVQWWKDGFKHVFPDPAQRVPSDSGLSRGTQEIREPARQALPSMAAAEPAPAQEAYPPLSPPWFPR